MAFRRSDFSPLLPSWKNQCRSRHNTLAINHPTFSAAALSSRSTSVGQYARYEKMHHRQPAAALSNHLMRTTQLNTTINHQCHLLEGRGGAVVALTL